MEKKDIQCMSQLMELSHRKERVLSYFYSSTFFFANKSPCMSFKFFFLLSKHQCKFRLIRVSFRNSCNDKYRKEDKKDGIAYERHKMHSLSYTWTFLKHTHRWQFFSAHVKNFWNGLEKGRICHRVLYVI